MTGFGRATRETPDETFEVEVRAVNNRSLKVQPRLSESASALAARVEHHIRERIDRGTIYVTVKHRRRGGAAAHRLDEKLLCTLFERLQELERELIGTAQPSFTIAHVAALPGVVTNEDTLEDDLDAFWERLRAPLDAAVDQLVGMRREEGKGIARDLEALAGRIVALADAVESRVEGAVDDYRTKLRARIDKLLKGSSVPLPEADLARELAVFADRSDISEEIQRLRSHIDQLRATLAAEGEPVGRKLDFLAQELLREANTMASKSHDTSLVSSVLEIKLEVEKVREQVANVE